ncbi:hypothetical protein HN446_00985 [bacterium]|jgi:hypothetical protein|nr:hypothetical protein [bacterium]
MKVIYLLVFCVFLFFQANIKADVFVGAEHHTHEFFLGSEYTPDQDAVSPFLAAGESLPEEHSVEILATAMDAIRREIRPIFLMIAHPDTVFPDLLLPEETRTKVIKIREEEGIPADIKAADLLGELCVDVDGRFSPTTGRLFLKSAEELEAESIIPSDIRKILIILLRQVLPLYER